MASILAYDLTVFLYQVEHSLERPRFLVHDGVFHGISRRTVVKALNYIHGQAGQAAAQGSPFQYIVTFNEDELTLTADERARDGHYRFDLDEATVLQLRDSPNEMLFRYQFS